LWARVTRAIIGTGYTGYSSLLELLLFRRILLKSAFALLAEEVVVVITKLAAAAVVTLTAFSQLRRELITRSPWALAVRAEQPEQREELLHSAHY
jgi:hypothetical protein